MSFKLYNKLYNISVIRYFLKLNDIFTLQGMYGFVEYLGYIWDQKISVWEEFCSKLSHCHYGTKFHTSWWPGNIWSTMQDIILNSNSSIKLPVGCEFITYTVEKHPTFFVHSSFLLLPLTQERQRNEKTSSGGHSPKNGNRTTLHILSFLPRFISSAIIWSSNESKTTKKAMMSFQTRSCNLTSRRRRSSVRFLFSGWHRL